MSFGNSGRYSIRLTEIVLRFYRPGEVIFFFNLPNPSGRNRPWGSLSL
jgi:hypothetical protein